MNIQRLVPLLILLSISTPSLAQREVITERVKLTLEFGRALQQGDLSNEDIMKKYVAEGYYLKDASVKTLADEYLNDFRKLKNHELSVIKYSEHEDEFSVTGVRSVGDNSTAPHKLRFSLTVTGLHQPKERYGVNTDDLFIMKIKNKEGDEGSIFILFDSNNKILSFAGMIIGDGASLMQF